ncbi:MAG: ACT domain-containing protein [Ferruginibacter sp.]
MSGETDLSILLKQMNPLLNEGEYVFCAVADTHHPACKTAICLFKEKEAVTLIMERSLADQFALSYSTVCSWITLAIHSSLEAVGLTAAFSQSLAKEGISCNVVAAFYHDHIFVPQKDAEKTMEILLRFRQAD